MSLEDTDWQPISAEELETLISEQLADCPAELQAFFGRTRIPLVKWQLSPWGDLGAGFWAIATFDDRVLWFNDIEDGFNVSCFITPGLIPTNEYWCNQDPLFLGLRSLAGVPGGRR